MFSHVQLSSYLLSDCRFYSLWSGYIVWLHIYSLKVVPIAIPRLHSFVSPGSKVPPPATFFTGMLFSASGFFNVVVYTITRPALLRPTPVAVPAVTHRDILTNEDQFESRSKLHVPNGNGHRRPSDAGRSEDSGPGMPLEPVSPRVGPGQE